jgi:ATP-binding cassette subfamily F protein 3
LSGGEKARLVLCLLSWQKPHLLVLDEPTNHLDLEMREALALALQEFDGAVVLVSHDRQLLGSVVDQFWLVANGTVAPYDDDLDSYADWLLKERKKEEKLVAAGVKITEVLVADNLADAVAVPKADRTRILKLEKKIQDSRKECDAIDLEFSKPELYQEPDSTKWAELKCKREKLQKQLEKFESEWYDLQEQK